MIFSLIITILSESIDSKCMNKCPETIDDILTYLEPEQYCGCIYKNSKVSIGTSIKKIPKYAFYFAEINEVHLHPDIDLIDECAFAESNIKINMQELTNIKTIGYGAFYRSRKITFYLPQTLETIGPHAFTKMSSDIKSMVIPNSVTSIGKACFGSWSNLTSISISNSVTSIGEFCFSFCSSLTSISIPNSVTSIGKDCFSYCSNLEEVFIGNGLQYINKSIFRQCNNLNLIETSADNPYFCTYEGLIYNKNKTKIIIAPSNISHLTISETVNTISSYSFYECQQLTSISIPNSVTSIGEYCFSSCVNLTSISIPNSVTSIGKSCFSSCISLTSFSIPNSVTSIGNKCFSNCYRLTSVFIPNNVTSIGKKCFCDCFSLSSISIPNSVTSIGKYCFLRCSNLEEVFIGNGLQYINKSIFFSCYSLNLIETSADNPYFCTYERIIYNKNKTKIIIAPHNISHLTIPNV